MKNKFPVLLLAMACAVLVWLYDVTVVNPNGTSTISGIPVEFENEAALNTQNLMITEDEAPTVTLKIYGRRSELKKLTRNNIKVSAELSEISSEGTHELAYTVRFPANVSSGDLSIENRSPATVSVGVERYISRSVKIRTVFEGVATEDDSLVMDINAMEITPNELTATGTAAMVASIDCARVTINKAEITQTTVKDYSYELLDQDGNVIPRDELTMSSEKVTVNIPVLKYKEVPLVLKTVPGGGATDQNISYTIEPETIKISGDAASVDRIHQIEIGTLNYADVTGPTTRPYSILMPEGINNASGILEATASMTVTGLIVKAVTIKQIELLNEPEGLTAHSIGEHIQLTLRGPAAAMNSLQEEDVHASVDLSDYTQAGTYNVTVTVTLPDGLQVGAIGSRSVMVTLS